MTVDYLFAALGGSDLNPGGLRRQESSPDVTNRGLELLDSLFASAKPATGSPEAPQTPLVLAPHVLTQDVISSLLGLDPSTMTSHPHTHSRSSSTSTSSSRLSQYSGDAEDEDEDGPTGSEGGSGYSRSSTVLNADMDANIRLQADVTGNPHPLLTYFFNRKQNERVGGATSVNGDVTPRAHLRIPPLHSESVNNHHIALASLPSH
jgi:hypothetical protein